jgi:hypothetical protein
MILPLQQGDKDVFQLGWDRAQPVDLPAFGGDALAQVSLNLLEALFFQAQMQAIAKHLSIQDPRRLQSQATQQKQGATAQF